MLNFFQAQINKFVTLKIDFEVSLGNDFISVRQERFRYKEGSGNWQK
jgi:hypothetical protein